jgi:hypothetical protein
MQWTATILGFILAAMAPGAAAAERLTTPHVPASLAVPDGYRLFSIVHATGTQNYICLPGGTGVTWAFLGPQATLFDERGEQVMTHFLSGNPAEGLTARPTWQHSRDTSAVWAMPIASYNQPDFVEPGAISWLLLRVVGTQYGPTWGDRLVRTAFIQRVNTSGGVAPAEGCTTTGDIGKRVLVPYSTDYAFYR